MAGREGLRSIMADLHEGRAHTIFFRLASSSSAEGGRKSGLRRTGPPPVFVRIKGASIRLVRSTSSRTVFRRLPSMARGGIPELRARVIAAGGADFGKNPRASAQRRLLRRGVHTAAGGEFFGAAFVICDGEDSLAEPMQGMIIGDRSGS